jgi:hypothetical protein
MAEDGILEIPDVPRNGDFRGDGGSNFGVSLKKPKRGPKRKNVKICSFRDFLDFRGSGRISPGGGQFSGFSA